MGRRIIAIFAAAGVALVGVVFVMLYARGADARAVAAQQPADVYVASQLVPTGTTIKDAVRSGLMVKTTVAAKGLPAGALTTVNNENGNLLALTDIQPGEYVLAARFGTTPVGAKAITVPPGNVAVSVQLSDPARVGTFVTPGSRVVLFNTYEPVGDQGGAGAGMQTRVLLDDVLVIAMGDTSLTPAAPTEGEPGAPAAEVTQALVTVAVSPADATRLVHGIQSGKLYAALRGSDAKVDLSKVVTGTTVFAVK
jgi:pilus assembly protein CpaB